MKVSRSTVLYVAGGIILIAAIVWIAMSLTSNATPTPTLAAAPTRQNLSSTNTRVFVTRAPSATVTTAATATKVNSPTVVVTSTKTSTPTTAPTSTPTFVYVPPTATRAPGEATLTPTLPSFVGFILQYLTTPAQAGVNAQATIKTQVGSACSISVTMPQGNFNSAKWSNSTTAGFDGVCNWVWKVDPAAKGTGFVNISSNGSTQSYPLIIQ